jgi:selenocysteine lyase/cysteine desulfurase
MTIPSQRHLFDIPEDLAYFDCAYLSPLLREVRAAGERGLARKSHPWTVLRKDFFQEVESARVLFARLIGAEAGDVALIPSTSYGMAVAGANLTLGPGQSVLVLANQHSSNTHQWRVRAAEAGADLTTVRRPADGDWTGATLAAVGPDTAVVAVPNCHWTDGGLVDLVAVANRCRALGAALVVDGTQSVGAMPMDLDAVRPDFLVCSAYKWLMCPYGLGFLYAAPHRQSGRPIEEHGWNRASADRHEGKTGYLSDFAAGARRYDMGERSNFITLPMAIEALGRLLTWEIEEIAASLRPVTEEIVARAAPIGLAAPPADHRAGHLVGLRREAGLPPGLVQTLAARKVHVSVRGDAIRVAPHLYNTAADIDRLIDGFAACMQ